MSSDAMDYYDVQAAIRDARSEIRGDIDRAVREATERLHDEIDTVSRALVALQRTVNARTEHLV